MTILYAPEHAAVVAQAEAIAWKALKANETLAQALADAKAAGFTREQLHVAQTVIGSLYAQLGGLK